MGNSITLFKKYIDLLDEVYQNASLSSVLDGDASLVSQGSNTHEIVIPKMTMDGLGAYSRNGGYVGGDVTLTNETVECNYDRGRSFVIDAMDNEETAGVAFGKLSAEFIRTKVVPELDAFRFAKYAALASNAATVASASYTTGTDVLDALVKAQNAMDENEVPAESRVLFITPTLYNLIQSVDTTKSKEVMNSFAQIVKVPQSRFYTLIKLNDGTSSGETAGGFAPVATTGYAINFMIVEKSAAIQYQKHTVSKVISPEENQDSDGWKFCYRAYGIADAYENKVAGIYLDKGAVVSA